ncbi:MAG: putative hemolysin activator-like protein with signal peptide [Hyphomicrobiales bacterium]|nr:putative hemolysin activator-like protein with signal peptide [Hyphomicrobiales bacterium]
MTRLFTAACIGLGVIVFQGLSPPALAQVAPSTIVPSQITPPTLRPQAQGGRGGVVIPESAGADAPAGSDKFFVVPGDLVVEGEFEELVEARQALGAGFAGKRISVAGIFELAAQLEQAYVRTGYALVRVSVPPQKIADGGPVHLFVVDGYIESINSDAVPAAVRDVVRRRTEALVGVRHMVLSQLERRLLIAGDVAGIRLRSTLTRGQAAGAVQLILDGTHRLVSGSLSIDNRLSSSLGHWQFGSSAAINSALGYGEQVYGSLTSNQDLRYTFSPDPRMRMFGAGVVLPVGVDGMTVTPEYTNSRTHGTGCGCANTRGELQRWSMRFAYPLIRTRTETLSVSGAVEHLSQTNLAALFNSVINNDDYTALRGSLDWSGTTSWGSPVSLSLLGAQGAGGRAGTGVKPSRQGAGPHFSKVGFLMQYSQPLPVDGLRADMTLSGQTTFNTAVFRSEQFALDGTNLVSGPPPGSLSVDRGVSMRGELVKAFAFPIAGVGSVISPYAFAGVGSGFVERPTSVERAHITGVSFGGGLRGEFDLDNGRSSFNVGLELARLNSNAPGVGRSTRLSFVAMSRF